MWTCYMDKICASAVYLISLVLEKEAFSIRIVQKIARFKTSKKWWEVLTRSLHNSDSKSANIYFKLGHDETLNSSRNSTWELLVTKRFLPLCFSVHQSIHNMQVDIWWLKKESSFLLLCQGKHPEKREEITKTYSSTQQVLVDVSTGYFLCYKALYTKRKSTNYALYELLSWETRMGKKHIIFKQWKIAGTHFRSRCMSKRYQEGAKAHNKHFHLRSWVTC